MGGVSVTEISILALGSLSQTNGDKKPKEVCVISAYGARSNLLDDRKYVIILNQSAFWNKLDQDLLSMIQEPTVWIRFSTGGVSNFKRKIQRYQDCLPTLSTKHDYRFTNINHPLLL